ncbi:hypothetical protein DTO271G3_8635 [Paecilomyces variotii]|nr:hypothetical protein DTO271G3_8635 [Paecilomyces variotii]
MHCILTLYTVKGSWASIDSLTSHKIHAWILATIITTEDIVDSSILLRQCRRWTAEFCVFSISVSHCVSYRSRGHDRTFSCHYYLDLPPEIALGTDAARKKFPGAAGSRTMYSNNDVIEEVDAPIMSTSTSFPKYESSFLPLAPDPEREIVSTRGQHLPGILRRFSGASLQQPSSSPFSDGATGIGEFDSRISDWEGFAGRNDDIETGNWVRDVRLLSHRALGDASSELLPPDGEAVQPVKRSARLIGNIGPRYPWEQFYTPPEKLKKLRTPVRNYYERMNFLITRYLFIDRMLSSSIAQELIEDYEQKHKNSRNRLHTIAEEAPGTPQPVSPPDSRVGCREGSSAEGVENNSDGRTAGVSFGQSATENTPLLSSRSDEHPHPTAGVRSGPVESTNRIVILAIYVNLIANVLLLASKVVITLMTSSVSVLASLVDASLDFLSTAIVWFTTRLTARRDRYQYPVGRNRLEPIGVLIFATIMITSFFQVGIISVQKLASDDHEVVKLGVPAIAIMGSTVAVKLLCWVWCRNINNSNVQALAQDAMTDVIFNVFSIIFPLVGTFTNTWFLDPLGGLFLSLYIMMNWAKTAREHVHHLTGAAASSDDRSVLIYLVMRFAESIKWIQGLEAYHSGDKLNVEVDVVLDGNTTLHDSHDIGESLQYMIESIPTVDRAFVHLDYAYYNLPTHFEREAR